jgi:hypothetical protein
MWEIEGGGLEYNIKTDLWEMICYDGRWMELI